MTKKTKPLPTRSLHSNRDKDNKPVNQQTDDVQWCKCSDGNKAGAGQEQMRLGKVVLTVRASNFTARTSGAEKFLATKQGKIPQGKDVRGMRRDRVSGFH